MNVKKRIENLLHFIEVYQCIGADTISKKDLQERHKKTMTKSTSHSRIKEVEAGVAEMLVEIGGQYKIDYGELRSFVEELCEFLGTDAYVLFAGPVPAAKGRRGAEPEYGKIEIVKETPQIKKLKEERSKLNARIKQLEEEKVKDVDKICDSFLGSMDRKLFIPATVVGIGDTFEEDLFFHPSKQILGKEESVIFTGGEAASCYEENEKEEYAVKKLWKCIVEKLMKSDFFKLRYEDEKAADEKCITKKLKNRTQITEAEIKENREKSIKELLDAQISNQAKLALYAGMHEYHGTEMEDLLNFAGDHGLEAKYVIQLLERPGEYNNYENVRGFLRQACKASEAKMKRAAAMELIAGEWYVMAMYNGKPCKFQMVPVDEILELRTALVEHVPAKVLAQTDKILGVYRKAAFKENDPEKEIVAADEGIQPIDATYYKEALNRLHQYELPSGMSQDAGMNEDIIDDFKEME